MTKTLFFAIFFAKTCHKLNLYFCGANFSEKSRNNKLNANIHFYVFILKTLTYIVCAVNTKRKLR